MQAQNQTRGGVGVRPLWAVGETDEKVKELMREKNALICRSNRNFAGRGGSPGRKKLTLRKLKRKNLANRARSWWVMWSKEKKRDPTEKFEN